MSDKSSEDNGILTHTPTPWTLIDFRDRDDLPCSECGEDNAWLITGPARTANHGEQSSYVIAVLGNSNEHCGVDQEANARLIVKAANNYYQMLSALWSSYHGLRWKARDSKRFALVIEHNLKQVKESIQKATGKSMSDLFKE